MDPSTRRGTCASVHAAHCEMSGWLPYGRRHASRFAPTGSISRALVAQWREDRWEVSAVGAPNIGERSEKEIISAFVNRIADLSPQLVTFNGSSFDLPVLRYRAMVCGVAAPGLALRPYFNRYKEDAIDLCDVLASFSPQNKAGIPPVPVAGCRESEGRMGHHLHRTQPVQARSRRMTTASPC